MAGIAGIAHPGRSETVRSALDKIRHRGNHGEAVVEGSSSSVGQIWGTGPKMDPGEVVRHSVVVDGTIFNWRELAPQARSVHQALRDLYSQHGPGFVKDLDGPFAIAMSAAGGLFIARGRVGVTPLYTATCGGDLCFASEVKALLGWAEDIREFPPGHYFDPTTGLACYYRIRPRKPAQLSPEEAAGQLRQRLSESIAKRMAPGVTMGSWLSGGLDSSAMAALARQHQDRLETFAVGVEGAPDLEHARSVADFIGADHHELVVDLHDMLRTLPEVIYHLESFDALLIRSSVTNFMVGRLASDHIHSALSGEGGDELFAGYDYLRKLRPSDLADELVDITNRLHNTALQRVDRCSSAHGLTAHTAFLDYDVLDFALTIPPEYKLKRNGSTVEKWVLRKAVDGFLPEEVLNRTKAKFWEGAGVTNMIEQHASQVISEEEFARERTLPTGATLNSREELFYYRTFRDHFGDDALAFVGRTKGAPIE